jgi:hypothetical protein
VINRPGAKFAKKLLGSQCAQVVDDKGPKVEDIVARKAVSLLDDNHFGAEQLCLNSRPKSTRTTSYNQHLFRPNLKIGLVLKNKQTDKKRDAVVEWL